MRKRCRKAEEGQALSVMSSMAIVQNSRLDLPSCKILASSGKSVSRDPQNRQLKSVCFHSVKSIGIRHVLVPWNNLDRWIQSFVLKPVNKQIVGVSASTSNGWQAMPKFITYF